MAIRSVVEATPDSHQHVGQDVLGTVRVDATPDVTLEWVEDIVDDGLEPLTALDSRAHLEAYVQNERDSVTWSALWIREDVGRTRSEVRSPRPAG